MTQQPFVVRRATPGDRGAIVRLTQELFGDHDWVPGAFDDFMAEPEPVGLYLAESGGRLLGFYHLEFPQPGETYLSAMRIAAGEQGHGIGSELCRVQVEHCRSLGAGRIYLLSLTENHRAHRTAEKNGFQNLGEWIVYGDLAPEQMLLAGTPRRARPAEPADAPLLQGLRAEPGSLGEIVCKPSWAWVMMTAGPADWTPAPDHPAAMHVVVPGPEGALAGAMLLSLADDELTVRRLRGTPEAAADLLEYAAAVMRRAGCKRWSVSLPGVSEPLLASLCFDPAEAFRAYVFRWSDGRQLS